MTMDGLCLYAALRELRQVLIDSRVQGVFQPAKDEVMVNIRTRGGSRILLLSVSSDSSRIHMTQKDWSNPAHPPMFCMLLRKHLMGARLVDMIQNGLERVVDFRFEGNDELGDRRETHLIAEIMGKHSNIILTDGEGKILDSIKHVNAQISSFRQVLPGLMYVSPPSQDRLDPLFVDKDGFDHSMEGSSSLSRILAKKYNGLSSSSAEEVSSFVHETDSGNSSGTMIFSFFDMLKNGAYHPHLLLDDAGSPIGYFPFKSTVLSDGFQKAYASFNEAIDVFYSNIKSDSLLDQKRQALSKSVHSALEKLYKKAGLLRQTLVESAKMEDSRKYGDLIYSHLYAMKQGLKSVVLQDFENGTEVEISLDEYLTPVQNAQAYYKKYAKSKVAMDKVGAQLEKCTQEIDYLENQAHNIEECTFPLELDEIRAELETEGFLRRQSSGKKKNKKPAPSTPLHYTTSDGYDIYVGKNNVQNEALTLHTARGDDMWLHVKGAAGSHVILKGNNFPVSVLETAGMLAAWHSKSRQSANVAVDYTLRKNVKKMPGGKPGMVIYVNFKTMYVTPRSESVELIKKEI